MSAPLKAAASVVDASSSPSDTRAFPIRAFWFAAAVVVLLVSSALALTRPPRADVFHSPRPLSLEWWMTPLETNGVARLTKLDGRVRAMTARPSVDEVWLAGDDALLVRTDDGGRTWQATPLPDEAWQPYPAPTDRAGRPLDAVPEAPDLYDVEFVDADHGFVATSHGRVLRTSDGGRSWAAGPGIGVGRIVSIDFADRNVGWAVDGSQILYRTDDGGGSWEVVQAEGLRPGWTRPQVEVLPEGAGWALHSDGRLYATEDGGDSFVPIPTFPGVDGPAAGAAGAGASIPSPDPDPTGLPVVRAGLIPVPGARRFAASTKPTALATRRQASPSSSQQALGYLRITAFDLLSRASAWVLVDGGGRSAVYATEDGGRTWERLLEEPGGFVMVHRADASRGWVAASDGRVYATADGGSTWTVGQRAATTDRFVRRGFARDASGRVWAVADRLLVETSSDGGTTWYPPAATATLSAVTFLDSRNGWVVGEAGIVLATRDGGRTWTPRRSPTPAHLLAVDFADEERGWAVGDDGTVIATRDGGSRWVREPVDGATRLVDVQVAGDRVWAVDQGGALYTRDPRNGWAHVSAMPPTAPGVEVQGAALHMGMDSTLWAVAEGRLGRRSTEGSWQPVPVSTGNLQLYGLQFTGSDTAWAWGRAGFLDDVATYAFRSEDRGESWEAVPIRRAGGTTSQPRRLHFIDTRHGWMISSGGDILRTADGGASWRESASDSLPRGLQDLHFVDPSRGWAVGDGLSVLRTRDGGETWVDPREPRTSVPPWYFLSWLVVAALLAPALPRPDPSAAEEQSVADSLASDRPITSADRDTLGLGRLARGISRFIRNVETEPPLTLAVTGPWGSGKSSLLNLVCDDLRGRGFRPVWFNAWHHQKEEHLLASLLANVRAQAVPQWLAPSGVAFRLRLLTARAWRDRWMILLLLFVFSASAGYFVWHGGDLADAPGDILTQVRELTPTVGDEVSRTQGSSAPGPTEERGPFSTPSVLAMLASLGGLFLGGLRGLAAFRVTPARLAAGLSQRTRVRDFDAQLGFRYRFAREFRDVTRALHPRTMVIVIDDLDRCRPENVLEVLEAVNFLVSCGDCFILMGMDVDRVVRCVGMGFKDVAEELADEPGLPGERLGPPLRLVDDDSDTPGAIDTEEKGRRRRTRFAYQYLEKLVNIEVPIPKPNPEQSESLLLSNERDRPKGGAAWRRRFSGTLAILAITATVALGLWTGRALTGSDGPELPPGRAMVSGEPAPGEPSASGPAVEDEPDVSRPGPIDPGLPPPGRASPSVVSPGAASPRSRWTVVLPLLVLSLAGLSLVFQRVPVVEQDSPRFKRALEAVHPLIVRRRNNPRSIKRFLNRVRYYAMVQDPDPSDGAVPLADLALDAVARRWRRLRARWRGRDASLEGTEREERPVSPRTGGGRAEDRATPHRDGPMPEDVLVLLASVQHLRAEWLEDERFRSDPLAFLEEQGALDGEAVGRLDELGLTGWKRLEPEHLTAFVTLSRNVRVL